MKYSALAARSSVCLNCQYLDVEFNGDFQCATWSCMNYSPSEEEMAAMKKCQHFKLIEPDDSACHACKYHHFTHDEFGTYTDCDYRCKTGEFDYTYECLESKHGCPGMQSNPENFERKIKCRTKEEYDEWYADNYEPWKED